MKCSTVTNLLEFTNCVAKSLHDRIDVHTAYTDFPKTFDAVEHSIPLSELRMQSFPSTVLSWLRSCLSGRLCTVSFNDSVSTSFFVLPGVPQSLFAVRSYFHFYKMTFLLINDLPSLLTCACLLYVSNIKLFSAVDSRAPQTSAHYLCDVLRIITNTLGTNFQQTLYFVLLVQNFRADTYLLLSWPTLKNDSLTRKLRGGTFDSKFHFNFHYVDVLRRASKIFCFALRSSHQFIDIHSPVIIFNSFICDFLEYVSVSVSQL